MRDFLFSLWMGTVATALAVGALYALVLIAEVAK